MMRFVNTDKLSWHDQALAQRIAEQIALILPAAIAEGVRLVREEESARKNAR